MAVIKAAVNALLGAVVRRGKSIDIGSDTLVNWVALKAAGGGSIRIGNRSIIHCRIDFDSPAGRVVVGDRCYIGASHLVCHTGISMGDDVIISWGVTIVDHDSHALDWAIRLHDVTDWACGDKNWDSVAIAPVTIGSRSWIGFGASILKGVTLGEGAVVGAKAVVTRDVAPYTVVAGNPARVVRRLEHAMEQHT